MRRILPLLLLLPVLAGEPEGPSVLVFPARDGVELEGLYYPAARSSAPCVVCLHALGKGPEAWESLARALQEAGYSVFSLRLRGHPERAKGRRSWLEMETQEFAAMASDLDAVRACLSKRREVDPSRLALVGDEFGANLALAGGKDPAFRAAVLLTPRLDARGLRGPEALEAFARPCLAVASADDPQGAKALEAMTAKGAAGFEPELLPADDSEGDFGVSMLSDPSKADLPARVVNWLKGALPPS